MLQPTIPGWKVETIGDDIAWMRFGEDGRLYAINPEAGFFGVAPGTGEHTNANAIKTLWGNCIFTNVALTDDGDVWWEGLTDEPPGAPDRLEGPRLDAGLAPSRPPTPTPASPSRPPSARSSRPSGRTPRACRSRRSCSAAAAPPRCRWSPSPSTGSTASSSAPTSPPRRPPRPRARSASCAATRSRCCRSAATTWATTSATGSSIGETADPAKLPRIYYVNWFRKDASGRFVWPGFGENSRVLKWIVERLNGKAEAAADPDRQPPGAGLAGHRRPRRHRADLELLLSVDTEAWKQEAELIPAFFETFGDHLPRGSGRSTRRSSTVWADNSRLPQQGLTAAAPFWLMDLPGTSPGTKSRAVGCACRCRGGEPLRLRKGCEMGLSYDDRS